ncbi:MAG: hypothetical protein ACRD0L_01985, partial [Acidimicrobiales bacterium]
MAIDPELAREQAHIDRAYAELARMRERTTRLLGESGDPDLEWALARRVALLADTGRPLCFGRIDTARPAGAGAAGAAGAGGAGAG